MFREELHRLLRREERHRRLGARLVLATAATAVVFVVGTALVLATERGHPDSAINGWGDAAFFTATQLLTVSSSLPNPVTTAGRVVDVVLEIWSIVVVTTLAGSFASFFSAGDRPPDGP